MLININFLKVTYIVGNLSLEVGNMKYPFGKIIFTNLFYYSDNFIDNVFAQIS